MNTRYLSWNFKASALINYSRVVVFATPMFFFGGGGGGGVFHTNSKWRERNPDAGFMMA